MKSKIISISTVNPEYSYQPEEIIEYVKRWIKGEPELFRKKVIRIFENAQIQQKYGILPIDKVFSRMSLEEKNSYYIDAVIGLGISVLEKAIDKAELEAEELDFIITTSCTGYMIPSFDAYLINKLGLKTDIYRLPVTEMGCAGGTAGLIYANNFLKANPDSRGAVISVETPSVTLQLNDLSMGNIVSSAIFADGAACVILGQSDKTAPAIVDTQMYHFRDTTDILGYNLTNSGFKIILDEKLPDKISDNLENIIFTLLNKNNLSLNDVNNFIFHPGGKKILGKMENLLGNFGKELNYSKEIMKLHGNMSSATVLYILDRFMKDDIKKDELGLMMAFGPGFTAQSILLKWC